MSIQIPTCSVVPKAWPTPGNYFLIAPHHVQTSDAGYLESNDPIVPNVGDGGVHRRAKAAVLACEVIFSDPKSAATGFANRNPDVLGSKEFHQLLEWRHANALYLRRDAVLD